jgi:hypothetical protein
LPIYLKVCISYRLTIQNIGQIQSLSNFDPLSISLEIIPANQSTYFQLFKILKMKNCIFLAIVVFSLNNILAQTNKYIQPIRHYINPGVAWGYTGLYTLDLNQDQKEELLLGGGSHFYVAKIKNGIIEPTWSSLRYPIEIVAVIPADINNDNRKEIYVVLKNGNVDVYDAPTLTLTKTLSTGGAFSTYAKIDNVDATPAPELITGSDFQEMRVIDLATGITKWQATGVKAISIAIGNVDDDVQNEIIAISPSGGDNKVIDAVKKSIEWQFSGLLGTTIAVVPDVDNDGIDDIISNNNIQGFAFINAKKKTSIGNWNPFGTGYIDVNNSFFVGDFNNNGKKDVMFGAGISWYCFEIKGNSLWEHRQLNTGIDGFAFGDPDNDGNKDFVFASGWGTSGYKHAYVLTFKEPKVLASSPSFDGLYNMSTADFDNDGFPEIYTAIAGEIGSAVPIGGVKSRAFPMRINPRTQEINNGYVSGFTVRFNFRAVGRTRSKDKAELFGDYFAYDANTFQPVFGDNPYPSSSAINCADIDKDGIDELIVGNNRMAVYKMRNDTFRLLWQTPLGNAAVTQIRVENCDADPALEIMVLRKESVIEILDALTGNLEWQSVDLPKLVSFDVADTDLNGRLEIVALTNQHQVFFIDLLNKKTLRQGNLPSTYSFSNIIRVAQLDTTPTPELLVLNKRANIYGSKDLNLLWESNFEMTNEGYDALITNVDRDSFADVFFSDLMGIYHYEMTVPARKANITSTHEKIFASNITLYPNPSKKQVHIEITDGQVMHSIKVFDMLGKLILHKNHINTSLTDIDISALMNGMYILQVENDKSFYLKKMIKE